MKLLVVDSFANGGASSGIKMALGCSPELAERCILAGYPQGGTVLDPFAGLGTTALVVLRHGRAAVIIELNPEYAEIARRRIYEEWRIPLKPEMQDFWPLFSSLKQGENHV